MKHKCLPLVYVVWRRFKNLDKDKVSFTNMFLDMPMGVATWITKLNEMHTNIIEGPSCISNYSWFWLSCWDPLVFLLPKTSKLFSNILLWAFLSKKRVMHTEVDCVRFHCTNAMFATDRWCLKIKKHMVMFLNVTKVRITCRKSQLYHNKM
jgi:hypothetical protein